MDFAINSDGSAMDMMGLTSNVTTSTNVSTLKQMKPKLEDSKPNSTFPSGWFRVAFSNELKPGQVRPLHYFDKHLVLFRTEYGTAHVLDAYCPHMGSHLGYGGHIKGNNIYCPYHTWAFDSQGSCVGVPYSHKTPPKVRIPTWPVCEVDGLIMVYYHPARKPPVWKFPGIQEWSSQQWSPFRRRTWQIRADIREIGENNLHDLHFFSLHGSRFRSAETVALKLDGPMFQRKLASQIFFSDQFKIEADSTQIFTQYGMGCVTIVSQIEFKVPLCMLNVVLTTPIDQDRIETCILLSTRKLLFGMANPFLNWLAMIEVASQLDGEIDVFENKIYLEKELIYPEDGPIVKHRQWTQQFYSESEI
ncbi:MAG: Rieske 2Fe-2S domain-containing protein [Cyanobacteria bacterium P01_F01_bin.13]